ncbi:MAG: hypothetical protein RLZZ77_2187 [Bacteroidota bacterium]
MAYAVQKDAVIDIYEHYVKQSYRSRFELLGANGILTLSLFVESTKGQKVPVKDMRLMEGSWGKNHMTSIRSAYGKSAFFEHLEDDLVRLFAEDRPSYLLDFNLQTLDMLRPYFKGWNYSLSTMYLEKEEQAEECRNLFFPKNRALHYPSYLQVFGDRFDFQSDLSVLDLVMNLGPQSLGYVKNIDLTI